MNRKMIAVALLAGLILLVGCNPAAEPADANAIEGIVWQWESVTVQPSGEKTAVPNPQDYTILFNPDGTFEGKADCNAISGTYTDENGFFITVGPSTMAFCGEGSLDQQYIQLLGEVVAGGPDGAGGLALENAGGEKRMLFSSGS